MGTSGFESDASFALENAADMIVKNPDFHSEMDTALTSNFWDNWANVNSFLAASKATLALYSSVNLRQVYFW